MMGLVYFGDFVFLSPWLAGFLGSAGVGLGYVSGMLYNWIGYIARKKKFSRYVLLWTWEPDDTWFLDICGRMNTLLFLLYCFCNPRLQLILTSFQIWILLMAAWGDCICDP
ncbi:hypothetical protein QR685DRAFT_568360 [Neurospora intermedia]|uniref:Uncharacterized protein n=1 Tax=Neurospora intermedia TaxID=5142 RepID=A0ABR3DSF6_NEUIN